MTNTPSETEATILEAARKVFISNGFDGSTMQMIADEARINKALLHYYYRNKDTLFESVFFEAFKKIVPHMMQIMNPEKDFFTRIKTFVVNYITVLQEVPEIPLFILHELRRNPDRLVKLVSMSGIEPKAFMKVIEEEIRTGNIREIDPMQLMVNLLAMTIFPFAARPMIQGFIMNNDEEMFNEFLEKRKTEVSTFIINAIKK